MIFWSIYMTNHLLSAIAATSIVYWSSTAAEEQTNLVFWYVNGILSSWAHSIIQWDKKTTTVGVWWFRYTQKSSSLEWRRWYELAVLWWEITTGIGMSTHITSHDFSFWIVSQKDLELRLWARITEFSDIIWLAQISAVHPEIGSYIWGVQYKVRETLYDPAILASALFRYPVWNNGEIYGNVDASYGLYSYSLDTQVGIKKSWWDFTAFWALWMNTFWFHNSDPKSKVVDSFLWYSSWSVQLWWQYCPTDKLCIDASVSNVISEPWKWNMHTNFWIHYSF